MTSQQEVSVPSNIEDPIVLKRFLRRLVQQLNIATGNTGEPSVVESELQNEIIKDLIKEITSTNLRIYVGPRAGVPVNVKVPTLLILKELGAPAGDTSVVIREPG